MSNEYDSFKIFYVLCQLLRYMILMIIVTMKKTLLIIKKLTSFVAAGAFGAFAVDALARLSVLSTTALW